MRPRANPLHPTIYHLFNFILTMEAKPLKKHLLPIANIIGEHIRQNCVGNDKAQTQKEICTTLSISNYLSESNRATLQFLTPTEFRNCINYLRNEKELMGCICSLALANAKNKKRGYFWAANPRELNDHILRLINRAKKQIKTIRASRKSYELYFKRPCGLDTPKVLGVHLNEGQIKEKFEELFTALKPIFASGKPTTGNYQLAMDAAIKFSIQFDKI